MLQIVLQLYFLGNESHKSQASPAMHILHSTKLKQICMDGFLVYKT